jgi:hypothetical protein
VEGLVDDWVYAVGLGSAQVIQPNALNEVTNRTGGYTILTDALDDDDQFKLAKYFLQIQAGITNEDIVVDPTGWIAPGRVIRIPFHLNESDISADVILMLPIQGIVDLAVESPDGSVLTPSTAMASPAITYAAGRNVSFYRFLLPLPVNDKTQAHAGVWHAVLKVREDYFQRYLNKLDEEPEIYARAKAHGVLYTLLVHTYSNLRMRAALGQTSYEPGATLNLTAALTEYGAPLIGDASVRAILTRPDGTTNTLNLSKTASGTFTASTTAAQAGVYEYRVIADGFSARRSRFTREQVLTGFVWRGGDQPQPSAKPTEGLGEAVEHALCRLLYCLTQSMSDELRKQWRARGVDIEALIKCYCKPQKSKIGFSPSLRLSDPKVLELLSEASKIASSSGRAGSVD